MTKLISIFFAALLLFVAAGCSDSSTNPDNGLNLGTMKCKVDGTSWQSVTALAAKAGNEGVTISGATMNIQSQQTETVAFTIAGTIVEGSSNTISLAQYATVKNSNSSDYSQYVSIAPNINITKVNDVEISGTFSFTGKNDKDESKVITEGQFRVKFVN
ncbi:MAG: hypothetical protein CVV22_10325 [Ignavibacteriae bacterium HGW-Ignavibacteriae-1]|jgi:hypothetical protein|nr:MAG: hypothetical protein CVV22_10325 [Ignavibacteriae bacterium HGW-Ignavibacteriae-1]